MFVCEFKMYQVFMLIRNLYTKILNLWEYAGVAIMTAEVFHAIFREKEKEKNHIFCMWQHKVNQQWQFREIFLNNYLLENIQHFGSDTNIERRAHLIKNGGICLVNTFHYILENVHTKHIWGWEIEQQMSKQSQSLKCQKKLLDSCWTEMSIVHIYHWHLKKKKSYFLPSKFLSDTNGPGNK